MLNRNQRIVLKSPGVRERKRGSLHGPIEGPPDVDDADAGFQKGVSFGGEVVVNALGSRFLRLVDVHAGDGVAGAGGAADGVIEEKDALGGGDVL